MFHKSLEGLDLHAPSNIQIENASGGTLTQLKVVKYSDFGTNFPEVIAISNLNDSPAGVMPVDLLNGETGFMTTIGNIFNVDTSPWTVGTQLFSDANGDLTATPNDFKIADVVKQDASTGIIFVAAIKGAKGADGAAGGSLVIFSEYIKGTTANPETAAGTSGTAVTIPEMTKTFTPADANNVIDVFFSGTFGENGTNKDETCHIGVFIDGTLEPETHRSINVKKIVDTDKLNSVHTQWRGSLNAAPHTIDIRMWIEGDVGATLRAIDIRRNMLIKEVDE